MNESNENPSQGKHLKRNSRIWWNSRRLKYNKGLFIAGAIVFILYVIIGTNFISPYDNTFEINFFTSTLQFVGYLFMMLIANIFYGLGSFIDIRFNKNEKEKFRKQLFQLGFWISVILPFLVPLKLLFIYFTEYS